MRYGPPRKASPNVKRSVDVAGRTTSVALEDVFWNALKEIAAGRNISVTELISTIKIGHQPGSNLSSAIRLFVLDSYRRLSLMEPKHPTGPPLCAPTK
jgi:predicted DNA-binding ribbon-helix-helix protein